MTSFEIIQFLSETIFNVIDYFEDIYQIDHHV